MYPDVPESACVKNSTTEVRIDGEKENKGYPQLTKDANLNSESTAKIL